MTNGREGGGEKAWLEEGVEGADGAEELSGPQVRHVNHFWGPQVALTPHLHHQALHLPVHLQDLLPQL